MKVRRSMPCWVVHNVVVTGSPLLDDNYLSLASFSLSGYMEVFFLCIVALRSSLATKILSSNLTVVRKKATLLVSGSSAISWGSPQGKLSHLPLSIAPVLYSTSASDGNRVLLLSEVSAVGLDISTETDRSPRIFASASRMDVSRTISAK